MMNNEVATVVDSPRRGCRPDWRNWNSCSSVVAAMAQEEKGWFERLGCRVSAFASDVSAHPFAQMGFILVCALWFAIGFATDLLTAILSIMAITLTQMVLNRQNEREMDDHRRDVAMHAKLDELVVAMKGARNEVAGIEDELDEDEIADLKRHALAAVEDAVEKDATSAERAEAHRRAAEAHRRLAKYHKRQKA